MFENQNNNSYSQVDFSAEEERIKSFISWPVHFPVDPIRLAKSGFYYTGRDDEVICFSCNGRIKNWNYGDIVQKKHFTLFPKCDFVNGRSNNVPANHVKNKGCGLEKSNIISINRADVLKNIDYNKMKSAVERRKTFENKWPLKTINVQNLAEAGFFYFGCEDKVQCPFCKGIISEWTAEDDPLVEHRKHFPWCDYLINVIGLRSFDDSSLFETQSEDLCGNMKESLFGNETVQFKASNKDNKGSTLKKLGIHSYNSPAHSQQANLTARIRSFISWPTTCPVSKEELAKAGFFYIGIGDLTKCFHCNGGLSNWEKNDDPWVEHARWFPNCLFLQLQKGEEFIKACVEKTSRSRMNNSPVRASSYFSADSLMNKVEEAMKSDMVKYVIDCGLFPYYIIRVAILRQIERTGSSFSSINQLCLAVSYTKQEMEKLPLNCEKSLELKGLDIRRCVIDDSQTSTSTLENNTENANNSKQNSVADCKDKLEDTENTSKKSKTTEDQCLCKICMDNEVGVVFLPCGHLLACTECAAAMELCPMCRKPIHATIRAYLP